MSLVVVCREHRDREEAREREDKARKEQREREQQQRDRDQRERDQREREQRDQQQRELQARETRDTQREREETENKELERKATEERERLEAQLAAERAVHKHFEESLRLAQQKVRPPSPRPGLGSGRVLGTSRTPWPWTPRPGDESSQLSCSYPLTLPWLSSLTPSSPPPPH